MSLFRSHLPECSVVIVLLETLQLWPMARTLMSYMEPQMRLETTQEVFVLSHPVKWPPVLMACTSYDSAPPLVCHCTCAEFEEQSKVDSTS